MKFALLWILFVAVPLSADEFVLDDGPAILRDPVVVGCFAHILSETHYGASDVERAAFLVATADHSIVCVDWPATYEFREARWSGPLPGGVVAFAHTHPSAFPHPSYQYVSEATRLRMAIFVVTPKIVSVVHSSGRSEVLAYRAEWIRVAKLAADR